MKIEKEKILGSSAAGDGSSRQFWHSKEEDEEIDYEALYRSFMEKMFKNRGAFKIGGSLSFEFAPKAQAKYEQLISTETAFCFHQFEENQQFEIGDNENDNDPTIAEYQHSAMDSYLYYKKVVRPAADLMEGFSPVI